MRCINNHSGCGRLRARLPWRRATVKGDGILSPLRRVLRNGSERGTALIETALTLPLILLVSVGIFEFGRAYQMVQVLTNAAREGARVAVLPGSTAADVSNRVHEYLQAGQVPNEGTASVVWTPNVSIGIGSGTATGSKVTVNYPFSFMVLNPVVRLVSKESTLGSAPITMSASAEMRNE
jgi:Flp pilus assembly protein TadG